MRIDAITIFPDYPRVLDLPLIGKAADRGPLDLHVRDLRDRAHDRHRIADDTSLGGGTGVIMKPDVWGEVLDEVSAVDTPSTPRQVLIIPTPTGKVFTQRTVENLTGAGRLVFACGRYEGIDARVPEHYASRGIEVRELSTGNYVLNGGEATTIVTIEIIAQLLSGIPGNPESLIEEFHGVAGLLKYSAHTRPTQWRGLEADPALLSGDHGRIARAGRGQALTRTVERRPGMVRTLGPAGLDCKGHTLLTRPGWAVPTRADHSVPVRLRNATTDDAHALTGLAVRTLSDAYGSVIDPEFLEHHTATDLVSELFVTWAGDDRVDFILTELLEPPSVRDGNLEGRASTGTTPAPVGYAAILREGVDSDEEQPHGTDPRLVCMRPTGREVVGELSKVYVDVAMRGSGLVPALMGAMARQAGAHRTDLFWLDTHVINKRTQKAYKRAGFRQVGTRTYNVGGQDAHDVAMTRWMGEGLWAAHPTRTLRAGSMMRRMKT